MRQRSFLHGKLKPIQKILLYLILYGGVILFAFPLFWMLVTSLKTMGDIHKVPMIWLPSSIQWSNYKQIFIDAPMGRYLLNSVGYTCISVFGTVLASSMAAFAFARLRARGNMLLFVLVLSTMMIPSQVTLIPQYLLFNQIHWTNSYLPLIVPAFTGSAFVIFLLRQFYLGISREMDEAVKIDGGGHLVMYWRILLPLSAPALATSAVLEIMSRWNDLFGPLIYLSESSQYPLSLGLANFTAAYGQTPWNLLMAASVVTVFPLLLLFFFAQKVFIQGIVISGSKG
ncbi:MULTISPECIES: carbohydrate ABC transporter permease [Paenibacillus]|uniref:Sugar ABC transporter ATP-binding protein n=1 Tax=Paenibacillus odorifer TaxID=189426 RepID=A0A1R0XD89_9BACL|nr:MULTISPECIES: carbohydrate ABC transporter permease [Paenibacillus]AIQ73099.1 sugar ABC transporter ATP-binding protein [Paenibacillus odorifer]ETT69023.1 sugar ABC transporter permease [Paenibacillus sp. FSL H8-237]MEC0129988.1 carbohydrate ABC transporter permease [Paenibacillus odorifer]MEC0223161.1 carbohydrate ABC transporter permease [Paenibacillus odorifer]OMC94259.1 sugar ABC transporter ATP-binding protein [Paenibacillus odorifer]